MKFFRLPLLSFLLLSFFSPPAHGFDRRTPVVDAIAKAGPAVVNIRTEKIVQRRTFPLFGFNEPFFEEFFNRLAPPQAYKTQSLGSGVIVDQRGYILTNAHVIEKASQIFVALPGSQKELEAELVGRAEHLDLAVLKLKKEGDYPFLAPADTDELLVGETVIAIGNPLGLGHSVTTGVVSAPRRRLTLDDDRYAVFIQTDALINPGNSGGPLLNINGELIGINTAIVKQAQGIGFSIPMPVVKRVLPDLIAHGTVPRAYLGIIPGPVGKTFAHEMGRGGVLVNGVDDGSPAAAAGIRYGDVILALDSLQVTDTSDLFSLLGTYTPGDRLTLKISRGFETESLEVRPASMPEDYGLEYGRKVFGLEVTDSRYGVRVKKVISDSAAADRGIQAGDLVAEVAGMEIETTREYARILEKLLGREPLRFLIVRDRRGYLVELP